MRTLLLSSFFLSAPAFSYNLFISPKGIEIQGNGPKTYTKEWGMQDMQALEDIDNACFSGQCLSFFNAQNKKIFEYDFSTLPQIIDQRSGLKPILNELSFMSFDFKVKESFTFKDVATHSSLKEIQLIGVKKVAFKGTLENAVDVSIVGDSLGSPSSYVLKIDEKSAQSKWKITSRGGSNLPSSIQMNEADPIPLDRYDVEKTLDLHFSLGKVCDYAAIVQEEVNTQNALILESKNNDQLREESETLKQCIDFEEKLNSENIAKKENAILSLDRAQLTQELDICKKHLEMTQQESLLISNEVNLLQKKINEAQAKLTNQNSFCEKLRRVRHNLSLYAIPVLSYGLFYLLSKSFPGK